MQRKASSSKHDHKKKFTFICLYVFYTLDFQPIFVILCMSLYMSSGTYFFACGIAVPTHVASVASFVSVVCFGSFVSCVSLFASFASSVCYDCWVSCIYVACFAALAPQLLALLSMLRCAWLLCDLHGFRCFGIVPMYRCFLFLHSLRFFLLDPSIENGLARFDELSTP